MIILGVSALKAASTSSPSALRPIEPTVRLLLVLRGATRLIPPSMQVISEAALGYLSYF